MGEYQIIEKILNRDQTALNQAEQQYGNACRAVAVRILGDERSAEMVVREAFLRAWESIPQKKPRNLRAYLLRITRNLSIDHAPSDGEYDRAVRELLRCIPGQGDGWDDPLYKKKLRHSIDEFLTSLAPDKRQILVLRYWYLCSLDEISDHCGGSTDRVRGTLKQLRTQLHEFLLNQKLPGLSAAQFLRVFGNIRDEWILEARESKRGIPIWLKGAALGVAICCAVALGMFIVSHWGPAEETQPQFSAETTVPFAYPTVSTTEDEPSTAAPTAESTTEPAQTEAPHVTQGSIRDSAAWQKLLSLENAEQFDEEVLEVFAQWIEDEDGFLADYPEKWELEALSNGSFSLTCYSPLSEDYRRNFCCLKYDGESVSIGSSGKRSYTSVPREEVAAKVYGAEDSIGVDIALKEEFIDFIMDSDWFPWSTLNPEDRTQWCFAKEPLESGTGDQTEYIQLFVKVWSPDDTEDGYDLCSLWYNGTKVMDGISG